MIGLIAFVVEHKPITATSFEIFCFVLQMLLIGVAEEILFRGIFQNAVMDLIGYGSVKKVRLGIIISGAVFGVVHITNAFSPEIGFESAAIQAITVATLGVISAAVYYKSRKNLWLLIVMHAFNDGCLFLASGVLSGNTIAKTIGTGSISTGFVLPVMIIMVDMWILRSQKLEEYICVNSGEAICAANL